MKGPLCALPHLCWGSGLSCPNQLEGVRSKGGRVLSVSWEALGKVSRDTLSQGI